MAAIGLLALPALADAGPVPVAINVRFGNHPAFTRVVVDFGGTISARNVEAGRLGARAATVRVAGASTNTNGGAGQGVRVALQSGTQNLHVSLAFAAHRFKYLSYAVVGGNRLAIDLWKSRPPKGFGLIHTCSALTLSSNWSADGSTVSASGHAHGIFENQFQVVVRGQSGAVLGRTTVNKSGKWSTNVHYHVAYKQAGTVEAVVFSAKDGALECIAQHAVELPAT